MIACDNLWHSLAVVWHHLAPHGVAPLGKSGRWSARDANAVAPLCQAVLKVVTLLRIGYFWVLSFVFDSIRLLLVAGAGCARPLGCTWEWAGHGGEGGLAAEGREGRWGCGCGCGWGAKGHRVAP